MRAVALALALLVVSGAEAKPRAAKGGRLVIAVDPRIELISIVFRLAGHREYNLAARSPYTDAVDAHFGSFREHPAITASRELRASHSISYDAPIELAVYLDAKTLKPIRALAPLPPGLDPRWQGAPVDAYLEKLRDFAAASRFHEFFAAQAARRAAVEARFAEHLRDKPIVAWFDGVFGARPGTAYLLAPGLLTGPRNYGVFAERKPGAEEIVQVISLEQPDDAGLPRPGEMTLELVVHELGHGYVNPILEARAATVGDAARGVFEKVEAAMRRQKYLTPEIVANEAVVRALVILFLRERGAPGHADRSLMDQEKLGFAWTADLAAALDEQRKRGGGRISPDALAETTRAALAAWRARQ